MFGKVTTWALSILNTSRELAEHRTRLRELDQRVRDLEEGFRMLSQELRHFREIDAAEREKLFLKVEALAAKALPQTGRRRRKKQG